MMEVSMITMNCASAMRPSAAQRRGFAVCMRFLSCRRSRLDDEVRGPGAAQCSGLPGRGGASQAPEVRWLAYGSNIPAAGIAKGVASRTRASTVKSNRIALSWWAGDVTVRHPLARVRELEQQ